MSPLEGKSLDSEMIPAVVNAVLFIATGSNPALNRYYPKEMQPIFLQVMVSPLNLINHCVKNVVY